MAVVSTSVKTLTELSSVTVRMDSFFPLIPGLAEVTS
jgi:hypothetical protein